MGGSQTRPYYCVSDNCTSSITKRHGLPEVVRAFQSFSARRINEQRGLSGVPVWQRNYYDRVIRNNGELNGIRQYIVNNPAQWEIDSENPTYKWR